MKKQFTIIRDDKRFCDVISQNNPDYTKWKVVVSFSEFNPTKILSIELLADLGSDFKNEFESKKNQAKLDELNDILSGRTLNFI